MFVCFWFSFCFLIEQQQHCGETGNFHLFKSRGTVTPLSPPAVPGCKSRGCSHLWQSRDEVLLGSCCRLCLYGVCPPSSCYLTNQTGEGPACWQPHEAGKHQGGSCCPSHGPLPQHAAVHSRFLFSCATANLQAIVPCKHMSA